MIVRVSLLLFAVVPMVLIARSAPADEPQPVPATVLDHSLKSIDGQEISLTKFKGRVLLLVNTASQCGYTPQYEGMQTIYEKYKDQGFEVLAFPANEFGGQEPGSDSEIKSFCTQRYKTTFPLFAKIVVKGEGKHPLYRFLTEEETNPQCPGEVSWNFTKFLVDRQGKVIARFEPGDEPEGEKVTKAIELAIAAK